MTCLKGQQLALTPERQKERPEAKHKAGAHENMKEPTVTSWGPYTSHSASLGLSFSPHEMTELASEIPEGPLRVYD